MDDTQRKRHAEQVAKRLSQCLEHFFQEISPRECGIRLELERRGPTRYQEGRGVESALVFHLPGRAAPVDGSVRVDNGGGNVYDVTVALAGGAARTFSVCMPDPSVEAAAVPPSVEGLCHHMLVELEREAGEQQLREATTEGADQP